jgi:mRNA-degrading endonuclease RelE of RelBE toxin-antitoxin system
MTDKITKLLSKLSKSDLKRINKTVEQIGRLQFEGLDVKVLKGEPGVYRARVGYYRIIFSVNRTKETKILSIGRRNEKTYKDI